MSNDDIEKIQEDKLESHKHYDVWREQWLTHWEDKPVGDRMEMVAARNKNGDYIGDKRTAESLAKYDIAPELADDGSNVCCIGWSEEHQKYFGWSHRAIVAFGLGDMIFEEDFGGDDTPFIKHGRVAIKNKADARQAAINFAEHIG